MKPYARLTIKLTGQPMMRTTANGQPYANCQGVVVDCAQDGHSPPAWWVGVIAFGELAGALARQPQGAEIVVDGWLATYPRKTTATTVLGFGIEAKALQVQQLVSLTAPQPQGAPALAHSQRNSVE